MTEPPHRSGQDHDGLLHRPAITPALTAEEWAEPHKCGGRDIVDCDICFGQHTRHARAALALYGQPFGFTHEMLSALDRLMRHDETPADLRLVEAMAENVAALLPPA